MNSIKIVDFNGYVVAVKYLKLDKLNQEQMLKHLESLGVNGWKDATTITANKPPLPPNKS